MVGVAVGLAGTGAGGVGVEPSHPTFTASRHNSRIVQERHVHPMGLDHMQVADYQDGTLQEMHMLYNLQEDSCFP